MKKISILLLSSLIIITSACKSDKTDKTTTNNNNIVEARPSPLKESKGTIAGAHISIKYGSPSVKGRTVFGALVPYDEVWRMGANEATNITTDKDVKINGQLLKAGKYAIFSIPSENEWTVIFNTTWDQWGSYDYEESKDALRFKAAPIQTELKQETLDFSIEKNSIVFQWDHTKIEIPVTAAS